MPRSAIMAVTFEQFQTLQRGDLVYAGASGSTGRVFEIRNEFACFADGRMLHWTELQARQIYQPGHGLILLAHRERLKGGGA